jgi:hypothetical protein
MRWKIFIAAGLVGAVLIGGCVIWPRVQSLCLGGATATEAAVTEGRVSLEGRTYVVRSYVSADYGTYIFPGGFLRGHPVAVAVSIRAADDGALPEVGPRCIRVEHAGESIERRAAYMVRDLSRSDGSPYVEVSSGIQDLPEWKPGDAVRIWLRLTVKGRPYVIDVGDAPVNSVA